MNSKLEQSKTSATSPADIAKYAAALALVVAGLVGWWWFAGQWPAGVRAMLVVAGLVLGGLVFMATAKGRDTVEFLSEARFELRKVVWPTRQEALRMTWIVAVVVVILSLLLGAFDWIIQWVLGMFLDLGR